MSEFVESIPVTLDPDIHDDLMSSWESGLGSRALIEYARSLGIEPPDDRDGWLIVHEFAPDGADLGLRWDNSDDEPVSQVD